ncbi:hypothetical protein H4217_004908 [Coemansia sp. RSA 1939]|nr:hypothetical protein H4217_004908 [Coemansia sp. RSA 1939]KAJ2596513.1 hypothetical protein EV177_007918 [Coemansia sp. RSA 1804]
MGYWYKNDNPNLSDGFMPPKLLHDAFYRALQDFPILAGHMKTDNYSRMYVDVNKDDLNMPVYTDTTCDMDYSDIEKIGFNLTKVPIDLYGTYGVPVPSRLSNGKIKPANIRILRFKNNSGVLVYSSILHCATDGYGYVHFMNRWAEVARWMQQQQQQSNDVDNKMQLTEHEYIHDRAIPNSLRSNKTTALSASEVNSILNDSNIISRWIARLSPEKRGWLIKKCEKENDSTICFFHIPSKRIEDLRSSVQKHAPPDVKYTINDILTTYLGIVVAQAKQKAKAGKKSKSHAAAISKLFGRRNDETPAEFDVLININVRSHVNHPDTKNYMGNMLIGKSTGFPYDLIQKETTDEVLAPLAQKIHELASEPHGEYYAQRGFLLDNRPDNLAYNTFFGRKGKKGMLITSNHSRFAHYEVDFGSGAPAIVRHVPLTVGTYAYIMPTNPKLGGYEVELKLTPDEMDNVIQNTNWMNLVDSYERCP